MPPAHISFWPSRLEGHDKLTSTQTRPSPSQHQPPPSRLEGCDEPDSTTTITFAIAERHLSGRSLTRRTAWDQGSRPSKKRKRKEKTRASHACGTWETRARPSPDSLDRRNRSRALPSRCKPAYLPTHKANPTQPWRRTVRTPPTAAGRRHPQIDHYQVFIYIYFNVTLS